MSSRVFVVEHRRGGEADAVVAFVGSNLYAARAFCLNNKDFDDGEDWWWAVYSVELDSMVVDSIQDLHFMKPDCTVIPTQPATLPK